MEAEVGMLVVETIAKIRCESARGPDADRHVKLLIQFAVEGSLSGAYSHLWHETDVSSVPISFCS